MINANLQRQFFLSGQIFTTAGLAIEIPFVNTNLKNTGTSFYRSGVSLGNYSPW